MKTGQIFWGTLLIVFGGLLLLTNYTSIYIYWPDVLKLWPFVFVLWGLSLLAKSNFIKGAVTVLMAFVLAIAIFASFNSAFNFFDDDIRITFNDDKNDKDVTINTFSEKYNENVNSAILKFKAGAGSFYIKDTTDNLFEAIAQTVGDNYNLNTIENNGSTTLDFKMKKTRFHFNDGRIVNDVKMKLNTNPEWQLKFDVGAGNMEADLSKYKIRDVNIDMGAASLWIKLGDKLPQQNIVIDAGASSLDILIPENAGCEIRTSVSLSSRDFDRFNKINSDLFRTDNFSSAEKKIYIELKTGVSSIDVKRYSEDWDN